MKKVSFALALILISTIIGCALPGIAFAASETSYSNVLDDLHIDETFDENAYKQIEKDYSLQVIQVAESAEGELFIYVYQPSAELKASSITLARNKDNTQGLTFVNYKLTFLNSSGVFFKYKITNFALLSDNVRYYNVASILRPWDSTLDGKTTEANDVIEKAYKVGKMWTVTTKDDGTFYELDETEVIEIEDEYIGYVNYSDGVKVSFGDIAAGTTSAHFVAFSTDRKINDLLEAELEFKTQDVSYKVCSNILHSHYKQVYDRKEGAVETHKPIVLKSDDYASNNDLGGISFSSNHQWKRIMTAQAFLAYHNNDDSQVLSKGNVNILDKQWVLSFYETAVSVKSDMGWSTIFQSLAFLWSGEIECKYTEVSDVLLLRLKFQTKGETYNLGVVANKQTGDDSPINETIDKLQQLFDSIKDAFERLGKWLAKYWWVILAVVGVIALGILAAFIKPVAKVLWWILKIIFYIVTLPVWLIIWGVRAIKKKKEK